MVFCPMLTLNAHQFQALINQGAQLVDVRQPDEVAIAAFPGALNLPLDRLPSLLGQLNPDRPVAVLCHHGVRSEMASRFLEQRGFAAVSHLEGGIDAWSQLIDPAVPRY